MADYKVNFKRRDALWVPDENKVGVAYAVCDSKASIEDIGDIALQEAERPERSLKIRDLEIAVVDMKSVKPDHNPELYDFIQQYSVSPKCEKKETGEGKPKLLRDLKYALQVSMPGATNVQMADYLGNVMNDVWGNDAKGPFYGSVIYRNPRNGYLDIKRN